LGTKADLTVGIVAGPAVWAVLLTAKYAMAQHVCNGGSRASLEAITILGLLVIVVGAVMSWAALQRTPANAPTDGSRPPEIIRFMALFGLASCAFFAFAVLAGDVPQWLIHGCQ